MTTTFTNHLSTTLSTIVAAIELVSLGVATIGLRATLVALTGQLVASARTS
jgi:hypothetical protein